MSTATMLPEFVGEPGNPLRVCAELHLARAVLVQECDGLPGGAVTWAHPLAIGVQLAALRWASLPAAAQAEGERAFRRVHDGPCRGDLRRCDLPRRLAAARRALRGAA